MGGILIGGGTSTAKFCAGFVQTFPDVSDGRQVGERVCDLVRNGLFHEGFIKAGLVLEYGDVPVEVKSGGIVIDPRRFFDAIDKAFYMLCEQIRSDSSMLKNFESYWGKKTEEHGKKIAPTFDPLITHTQTGTAAVMPTPILKNFIREM
jgi:hypothetical protein